jgi:lipopolysaccharide transport system ATP-binding protein
MPAIITVENLSKAYRIGLKEQVPDTLVGAAQSWVRNPLHALRSLRRLDTFSENGDADDVVWALKDVSFEVQQGEVLGIIGRNGAGKSTLLKILSGITDPTAGRAVIRGRVSSLLEVGTGFHQEMTGRENIYMNGTILGMTKREIDRKFDEIVDFSGVEKFLDTPIKRYSSGMQVRLAFAVAAHLEPEILIVDEVLAVGDAEFQRKCLDKMKDVSKRGRTVLFVSHNMVAVQQFCGRSLLLACGQLSLEGESVQLIHEYLAQFDAKPKGHNALEEALRSGSGSCRISQIRPTKQFFAPGNGIQIRFTLSGSGVEFKNGWICAYIVDDRGAEILQCDSRVRGTQFHSIDLPIEGELSIQTPWLRPGLYRLDVFLAAHELLDAFEGACYFKVAGPPPYPYLASEKATARGLVLGDFEWTLVSDITTAASA